jgi:hypothetical protein
MDLQNLGSNFSILHDHLQFILCLFFGLPLMSFVSIRFWIAARASRVQRTTSWFVPDDLESDAARLHYSLQHHSVAFANSLPRHPRHANASRNSASRRSC